MSTQPEGRFHGHVALVTGAAGTIGTAMAHRLASEGAAVAATDKSARRLDPVVAELRDAHDVPVNGYVADLAVRSQIDEMLEQAASELGTVDILVNNAAVNPTGNDFDYDPDLFEHVVDVDLVACWYLIRRTLGPMREQGWGSIVNISSVAAYYGGRGAETAYSASKAALQEVTRAIAIQGGRYGIRCNAIAVGLIESNFTEAYRDYLAPEQKRTPLRRFGRPEEVADVLAFLVSEQSSFITGSVLNVSGGWYLTT